MSRVYRIATLVGLLGAGVVLPAAAQQACVRAAHLSPDAPAVDILVDGAEAFTDVSFPAFGPYANLMPEGYGVQVTVADSPETVVLDVPLRVQANRSYTVVAVGELADIEALVLADDNAPTMPGMGTVRVLHASPDAPLVDITLPDGTTLIDDLEFKTASEYLPLPVGDYTVQVRDDTGTMVVVDDIPLGIAEGQVVTVAAVGLLSGEPAFSILPSVDAPNDCASDFQSFSYAGMWFDPAQNGQGVQLAQNGDVLQGAWYVYDETGMPTFFSFDGMLDEDGNFSGDLLSWSGPPLGTTWDESLVDGVMAGTVSIDFADAVLAGELDWSLDDGPSGSLSLVPYIPAPAMEE